MKVTEAVAEAWASIDGKLESFRKGRNIVDDDAGHYVGYMADAQELIERVNARGVMMIPVWWIITYVIVMSAIGVAGFFV